MYIYEPRTFVTGTEQNQQLMKKRIWIPIILVGLLITTAATTYKSNFFEIAKQLEIFTEAYKQINMNYVDEVNPAEMMDVAITSMFAHLDPYTNYWNAQEVKESRIAQSSSQSGIGASIEVQKNKVLIKEVLEDLPADRAGLKAGDELLQIGDTKVEDFTDNAGELLKGAPGTKVELRFNRQGEQKTTTLKREKVQPKLVPFYHLTEDQIGYIKLTEFGRSASREVENALRDLKAQGAETIILDLRNNPGGLLGEAVNISNLFLPKDQLIVSTQSTIEKYNKTYVTQNDPVDTEIPVAILVNAHSASASEIVAGSLQDLDRGIVVGAQSFGKGLVQRVRPLKYETQMKLTISRYYTPSGRCIQALDYSHRDENGNPIRATEKDYKAFKTKNGRTVYDAGGVIPDVKLETSEISGITQALLRQNVIFDFATDYYYKHQLKDAADFKWSDKDYRDFITYLKSIDFEYQTQMEKDFSKAFAQAEDKELQEKISDDYQSFMTKIKETKAQELNKNKAQIEQQLTDEILRRYFYEEGYYQYALDHNPEILKATNVLNDSKQYKHILGMSKN